MRNVSAGVAMRFWSAVRAGGPDSGDNQLAEGLLKARTAATSCGEHTKPRRPGREPCGRADPPRPTGCAPGRRRYLAGVHAGQHGDGEEFRRIGHANERRARRGQHRRASGGVNGQHVRAQACGGSNSARHGVGNVVELQVEEDRVAAREDRLEYCRSRGHKEFQPHLEPRAGAFQPANEFEAADASATSRATISRRRADSSGSKRGQDSRQAKVRRKTS